MDSETIRKIQEYIEMNLKSEFSLDTLAEHAGYSPYHLTREFKAHTKQSIMEYARTRKILGSAKEISSGHSICDVAMEFGFETHAGFTKAFECVLGCSPSRYFYHEHFNDWKGAVPMENAKITIRPICKDDVNELWENVYSAMTPKQIMDIKILPSIESYERKEGIHLVAEINHHVIMALLMMRIFTHPVGFLFDNQFILSSDQNDQLMKKLLDEMTLQSRRFGISTLAMWQPENSKHTEAFQYFGFTKVFSSGGMDYLMQAI